MTVEVFGIRHHGPGSARSVARALDGYEPDLVLIEGPPEASALIGFAADSELVPPVAILAYDPGEPSRAGFYPFAVFSPEWQAMRHALARGIEARFIDLPLVHGLMIDRRAELLERVLGGQEGEEGEEGEDAEDGGNRGDNGGDREGEATDAEAAAADAAGTADTTGPDEPPHAARADPPATDDVIEAIVEAAAPEPDIRLDPLGYMGRLAGEDGERWWERLVEERRAPADTFAAIVELMVELRGAVETLPSDLRREAAMRLQLRAAVADGFQRIAVVCGAWHAPALIEAGNARADAALLKGLPRTKVECTWVPWSDAHLASASGYGAGIESPGWYRHLWTTPAHLTETWMTKTARVLREEGMDVSSAHLIEASRLAEGLAALRGRGVPGLAEMLEASRAVLTFGADVPLQLVRTRLIVGTALGSVPASVETAPLARDLAAQQRRLRLPPATFDKTLELDLRGDTDLARSHLLHRLRVLDVPWGVPTTDQRQATGTFRELWRLRWDPVFAVALVTQSRWGNTIPDAASARLTEESEEVESVTDLAQRIELALLASLPNAVTALVDRLAAASAVATDVTALMDALPSLARSVRYGNVRGTDRGSLAEVTEGIVIRASLGLPLAVASLDDDAAGEMVSRIESAEGAVSILEREELRTTWLQALEGVSSQRGVHGRVAGRVVRILLDRGRLTSDDVAIRVAAAVSRGATPPEAASFVEGFLAGPGALLVHDPRLFAIIDDWLSGQSDDAFTSVLPLLRRTFARFTAPERRALGERATTSRAAKAIDRRAPGAPASTDSPTASPGEPGSAARPATPPPSAEAPADTGFDLLDDLLGLGGRE
jgi:hypothetical protein